MLHTEISTKFVFHEHVELLFQKQKYIHPKAGLRHQNSSVFEFLKSLLSFSWTLQHWSTFRSNSLVELENATVRNSEIFRNPFASLDSFSDKKSTKSFINLTSPSKLSLVIWAPWNNENTCPPLCILPLDKMAFWSMILPSAVSFDFNLITYCWSILISPFNSIELYFRT